MSAQLDQHIWRPVRRFYYILLLFVSEIDHYGVARAGRTMNERGDRGALVFPTTTRCVARRV
eukprot:scaffold606874_cov17-Prasinocladus_malaysianus.AAC.1